jgi:acetylornithine deacetylase
LTKAGLDLWALAKRLISIPSVTGEEGDLADFLKEYLSQLGLEVVEQSVEGRRRNILASAGRSPRILLCTHQDTVPPTVLFSEDEDYLYGRGACDAKGIMASMIMAFQSLPPQIKADCGLLFLVGEETDSLGAQKAGGLEVSPEFIIVGEPTENKLGLGHKGYIAARISACGQKAHSGYPQLGRSAILELMEVLQRLQNLDLGRDPLLGSSSLNIGRMEGGVAANVVPDKAWAEISIRSVRPSSDILTEIRAAAADKASVEVLSVSEPQKLYTVPGFETIVLSYSTDIPYLKSFGQPLLFGPGSIHQAHTDQERISKSQMREAVALYQKLAGRLLAESPAGGRI